MKKYVVFSKRLEQYLYALGFNCEIKEDNTGKKRKIFLFKDGERLQKCIDFYRKIHIENQQIN